MNVTIGSYSFRNGTCDELSGNYSCRGRMCDELFGNYSFRGRTCDEMAHGRSGGMKWAQA